MFKAISRRLGFCKVSHLLLVQLALKINNICCTLEISIGLSGGGGSVTELLNNTSQRHLDSVETYCFLRLLRKQSIIDYRKLPIIF